jgi:hypothetical protein
MRTNRFSNSFIPYRARTSFLDQLNFLNNYIWTLYLDFRQFISDYNYYIIRYVNIYMHVYIITFVKSIVIQLSTL